MAELGTQVFSIIHKYILECNCIKFSILPVILIVSAAAGLKFWLKMEMILSVLFGIALTFEPSAKFLLGLQMKGSIDQYQLFLCSLLGCYLIYSSLFTFFLQSSKDESVFISHFWSKIISSNLMFITMGFAYLDGLRWNFSLLCFSGGPLLITLLINVFFLLNSNVIRSQNHSKLPANCVAKIEFFMLLTAGLVFFAFPDNAMLDLKKANEGHRMLARCCGALLFSLSIESFTMPSFLFEVDKTNFLKGRLLGSLLELVVIFLGYFHFKVITTMLSLGIYLFVNITYNILIIYGWISCSLVVKDLKTRVDTITASSTPNASINTSSTHQHDE